MNVPAPNHDDAFGDYLCKHGVISADGLARAVVARKSADTPLHIVIERLGLAREDALLNALAKFLDVPLFDRRTLPEMPVLRDELKLDFLKQHQLLPIAVNCDSFTIAFSNPINEELRKSLEFHLEGLVQPIVASVRDIEWALGILYESDADRVVLDADPTDDDIEALKSLATEQPVIRFVNRLIEEAVERRASDIHLEPEERGLLVRFRVDGVLMNSAAPPSVMATAITSRIKIMAKLNIAERRMPQDGRIRANVRGAEIDLRISTTPTLHGESVVIRILDKSAVKLEFSALGFSDDALDRYKGLLARPNGIILVTGPTGSGKTTTLYTSLKALNDGKRKIFSVEDPVEYQLAGVNQIPAHSQIGLTFARALRSILRQDPDIIMIGEIRDLETAEIAIQASLTGHLVLATLHTNSAASTITRLLDMGVENYLLSSTVIGVAAQRLVRNLCRACARGDQAALSVIEQLSPKLSLEFADPQPKTGHGCAECQNTGYKGRSSIIEVMPVTSEIHSLIMNHASERDIESYAKSEGMKSMLESGFEKVFSGQTSLEEVLRVAKMS